MPTRVLVPSGVLGLGFDRAALARGVAMRPDIICIDGGSTDSGPFSLGAGQSKYSRAATKSEWRSLMQARAELGVPLVIGTAGTCGTDSTVDWMYDITIELAQELGQSLKIARLYSSQPVERIAAAAKAGQVTPLTPAPELDLSNLSNIVALAGAEHIQAALETGADIVIAGRTTDTATIAALPLSRGDAAAGPGMAPRSPNAGRCVPPIRPRASSWSISMPMALRSNRWRKAPPARRIRSARICSMRIRTLSIYTNRAGIWM